MSDFTNSVADIANALSDVAGLFGLGSIVDAGVKNATISSGGKVLTSADVNNIINRIIHKAKTQGNSRLAELNNRLTSLLNTIPKSNAYRKVLQSSVDKIQRQIIDTNDIIEQAEERINNAKNKALYVDSMPMTQRMSWGGQASKAVDEAKSEAQAALDKYNELEKLK